MYSITEYYYYDVRSDEDKRIRKEVLKTLMDYSSDETLCACDPDSSVRTIESQSRLIFGNNSFVSFVRGMKHNCDDLMSSINQSTPIPSRNKQRPFSKFQSPESQNIPDSEFFDSETGKQQILKDQASHEKLFVQRTDCTGCSSWAPCSRKKMSSMPIEYSKFKQKESVSVGEFIGVFSENVSFTDNTKKGPFFNYVTSTPIGKRKSLSLSSLLDISRKESPNTSSLSFDPEGKESFSVSTPTSIKPLKFSTPKWTENSNNLREFRYLIGSTASKNIQRLRKEEKLLRGTGVLSFSCPEDENTTRQQSSDSVATGSNVRTYVLSSDASILMSGKSCNEQWFVEPQLVVLDPSKGNRVRLVNNSNKNLRFKTTFHSKFINISPLSGTVPAMDQIGLRVIISQYAKKRIVSFEDDIKVIIGKNEKSIHVKFIKEEKSKSSRERSYIFF